VLPEAQHQPAVLLVTHDVDEAVLLADRAVVLRDGRLASELIIDVPDLAAATRV
jgi:sulfonate transport system ATP-binding protein